MIVEEQVTSEYERRSVERKALLENRLRGAGKVAAPATVWPRASRPRAPLSFAQQRLWILDQLEPGSPLYNIAVALRLRGRLDRLALQKALNAIVARHEALRTRFEAEDGSPVQVILEPEPLELRVVDLSGSPESEQECELQPELLTGAQSPFDLSRGPPLRATLFRLDEARHVLLLVTHHIVSDLWSLGVFFREFAALYGAFHAGREPCLPQLPLQYADFAAWHREQMAGETMEKELGFWKRHLAGAPHSLELPTDLPRPARPSLRGGRAERLLPAPLAARLNELSRAEGASLFMTLLAGFKALLHRLTRQSRLVVGTPIAGRTQVATEGLIGFFVSTLPLHTDLSGNPSFRELLARVRHTVLDGFAHQDLPLDRLLEVLHPDRSPGHAPLVPVLFTVQTAPAGWLKLPDLEVEAVRVPTGTAKFDLTVGVEESPEGLRVEVEYSAELFNEQTIARWLGHFQTLLEGVVADPAQKIGALPLLTGPERNRILGEWNDNRTDYPREKTISQLFEEQAGKMPDATALVFDGRQLAYRELNDRANQLAHQLRKLGFGPGAMAGVCLERSFELIVALLGILKAGGAYVALDPGHPRERLESMLADVQAPVVLTLAKFRPHFAFAAPGRNSHTGKPAVVCLDESPCPTAPHGPPIPPDGAGADSPAYVSFTSGSTGRPKGVVVPHRGVVRLVKDTNYARFRADERFLQLAPVAFDASTFEIWGALLNGATLVVLPPGTPSLAELAEFIRANEITTLWLTAGLFHQMVEEQIEGLKPVRQLLAGGDVLSVPHVKRALQNLPGCEIINGYGPTESTTFTCCHRITAADCHRRSIPIGRPVANTRVYVLDQYLQPAPAGIPGELCIGGDGLALGYLNEPELNRQKFIPNPFSSEPASRLYRSGDLARWLPDGTIEFLGRLDQQVKIRGFRVELGEIEAVLNGHPAVRECAVTAWDDATGGKQLAAHFVADPGTPPEIDELRAYLRRKLPDYMVPASFELLESLPLNDNGKVNRGALPPPVRPASAPAKAFVAPRDQLEAGLARIWEEVLEIRPAGIEDHFFDLGGHSLLAVRLVARIEKLLGRKIPVAAVFQAPTIAQLAVVLREKTESAPTSSIVGIQPRGPHPPLFLVHGVGGGMFWGYSNLSKYLGPDQPVFAFRSRGMDRLEEFGTIETMAAQYVADLRGVRAHGPYQLGGYCFGGNVAYEMARQLEAQGEQVSLLALMNCAPPNSSYARIKWTPVFFLKFLCNLYEIAAAAATGTAAQRRVFFRWARHSLKKLFLRLRKGRIGRPPESDPDQFVEEVEASLELPEDVGWLWKVHLRALVNYHPGPYGGRVTLLRSRSHPPLCSFDAQCGWNELVSGGVTVKIVPGDHEHILAEPHARGVAAALKEFLREPSTGQPVGTRP